MTTIALMIRGWDPSEWADAITKELPDIDLRIFPDMGDVSEIDYALVWNPDAAALCACRNLKAIFSLGAGVDHILKHEGLPDVPIIRVVDPDLTMRMSEYVVWRVLDHHRMGDYYRDRQQAGDWNERTQPAASEVRVGIMGLGELGRDAALCLSRLGFDVAGWSRSAKSIEGVHCFDGDDGLKAFLARTDILVCLLPLTPQTTGIIDADLLAQLPQDGALGGPFLINAGRGGSQVEDDILTALDAGTLQGASLDVFRTEPLPEDSPFWSHPKVFVTPHCASASAPSPLCRYIGQQIEKMEAGGTPDNVVDPQRGY